VRTARLSTICFGTATGIYFRGAVRRRGGQLAPYRSGRRRGGARSGTGDAPQRPPTWQHPPGTGKRPPVTDATADAPRPPQRPQDSKHFSTASSRPGPPPRDVAANAAAPQRALPPPRPRHASTAAAAGHAHARGQARARRTAPTGREWTAGGRAWRRGRRAAVGGGLSTRRSRSLPPFLLSPCPPTSLLLAGW